MQNTEKNEQDLIFKAYQRSLLRRLNAMQEAIGKGERISFERMLDELIDDTKQALND